MIALVGDVMLLNRIDKRRFSKSAALGTTIAALHEHDLVVANLEMPLSRRGWPMPKHTTLRSDPDICHDVKALGIDAVTLANNHILDYGLDAMFDTVEACTDAGIACCGVGSNLTEGLQPLRREVGGHETAILGVACTLPNASEATVEKPGVVPIRVNVAFEIDPNAMMEQPGMMPIVRSWPSRSDLETVCGSIGAIKAKSTLVIVALHWGVQPDCLSPYQGLLAEYQQPLGHALIDAGADVVWGHHPHVLHPIEIYRGKPILYSLGNFLFEQPRDFMERESVIVTIRPYPFDIELTPVLLGCDGFPGVASGEDATRIVERLTKLSAQFSTQAVIADGRARLRLPLDRK